jgi:hypothetical protein
MKQLTIAAALALALFFAPVLAAADAPNPMAPFGSWEGTWKGEGWFRFGPGEPARVDSLETIELLLGGEAVLVRGLHHAQGTDRKVHDAVALLSWDETAGEYLFRTQVAGRGPGDFRGRMEDGKFVWGGPTGGDGPGGEMRYVIDIQGDRWHEIGEMSIDGGETWMQFFEMNLERVSGRVSD